MAERLESVEKNGSGANGHSAYAGTAMDTPLGKHLRRYMPFYALGLILLLLIIIVPSRQNNGSDQAQQANQITDSTDLGGDTGTSTTTGSSTDTGSKTSGVGGRTTLPGTGGRTLSDAALHKLAESIHPTAWKLAGTTRGGFGCKSGVRQIPWSAYAPPCYPAWSGNNGGSTARGVTSTDIVIVSRHFADSANQQATDAIVASAGFATGDAVSAADKEFRKYFNKIFELWGRHVKYIDYVSKNGNSTDEALGKGSDVACSDADDIIAKHHPFMVVGTGKNSGSTAVFAQCAAKRKLMVYGGGAYYPEWYFQKYHPYIWIGTMNCTMIAYQNSEYVGKQLAHRKPLYAKQLEAQKPERIFGLIVPTNVEYQSCVDIADKELQNKYNLHQGPKTNAAPKGESFKSRYNYQLDVSRLADQASVAIAQFHSDGVTTIFLACDPLIPIFLTQQATSQAFNPEWVTNGAGLTDVEQFARLWDQPQIQHSLFGQSQVDTPKVLGLKGEGPTTYKKATGRDIPPGTQTQYYAELSIFGLLQVTGPVLTYENVARGIWSNVPGGAPTYEVGYTNSSINPDGTKTASKWCSDHGVSHGCQHTSVSDMREIYWVCTSYASSPNGTSRCSEPTAYDGQGGEYRAAYNDKRFKNGEWPREAPKIYPPGT